jgi:multidrug efflux pump subunit AcrA (membrane-fusion protein)
LVNTRDLEAEVHVLESDLGTLDVGYPALLTIPAVGQTLPVRVSVVNPRIDTESRTCKVLFRFENPSPRIRPGMFVRAEIATQIIPDMLLVPKEAVLERDKRPLVFKVDGDLALWVYVQTGDRNDLYVEVTGVAPGATLEAGDRVVVSDHLTLAHEALIDVRQTVTPKDTWRDEFPDASTGSGE